MKKEIYTCITFLFITSIITLTIYWNGLYGPPVFDDIPHIAYNSKIFIENLDLSSLKSAAFSQKSGVLQRPIALLSLALNYYTTGTDTFWMKLTNLVIHIISGFGLFLLARFLLARFYLQNDKPVSFNQINFLAGAVGILWLVHPLNLTSVLYIVQRMNQLSALFLIAALLSYIWGRTQIEKEKKQGYWIIGIGYILFGLLSVLSKENGALLPLFIILIEILVFRFAVPTQEKRRFKIFWSLLFLLPIAAGILAVLFFPNNTIHLEVYDTRTFSLYERLLTEARVLWFYISLSMVPDIGRMGLFHDDFLLSRSVLQPLTTLFSIIGILLLLTLAFIGIRIRFLTVFSFGIFWFFIGHILESTVIPLELIFEHRNYLPQFGLLFALIFYITFPYKFFSKGITLRYILPVILIMLYAFATFGRAINWSSEWNLYNSEVANHPSSPRAHSMLGILMYDNKFYDKAKKHLSIAAMLDNESPDQLLRLMQHTITIENVIENDLLNELEYRIDNYSYSQVTVWIFESLLAQTSKHKVEYKRLFNIYEKMLRRNPDILNQEWQLRSWEIAGVHSINLGRFKEARDYFMFANKKQPKLMNFLFLTEISLKLGKKEQAVNYFTEGKKLNAKPTTAEKKKMDRLGAKLRPYTLNQRAPGNDQDQKK
ncbi:MAG: tetratricopeptide repeat protein [Thiohalomonadales bacterium]